MRKKAQILLAWNQRLPRSVRFEDCRDRPGGFFLHRGIESTHRNETKIKKPYRQAVMLSEQMARVLLRNCYEEVANLYAQLKWISETMTRVMKNPKTHGLPDQMKRMQMKTSPELLDLKTPSTKLKRTTTSRTIGSITWFRRPVAI
jgi:hypothetical protein